MQKIILNTYGPVDWFSRDGENIFNSPKARELGVYLWTIPYNGGYLVYYVGQTGKTFRDRMTQHTKEYSSGNYSILNIDKLKKGIEERLCGKNGSIDHLVPKHGT